MAVQQLTAVTVTKKDLGCLTILLMKREEKDGCWIHGEINLTLQKVHNYVR